MGYLNREDILSFNDRVYEDVDVPEWGGTVRLTGLLGFERDKFEATVVGKTGKSMNFTNFRARLVALCIVDEDGERVFSDMDIGALGRKSAAALDRVFSVAQRLSGLSDDDVKELTEDFDEGQSDSSTFG